MPFAAGRRPDVAGTTAMREEMPFPPSRRDSRTTGSGPRTAIPRSRSADGCLIGAALGLGGVG